MPRATGRRVSAGGPRRPDHRVDAAGRPDSSCRRANRRVAARAGGRDAGAGEGPCVPPGRGSPGRATRPSLPVHRVAPFRWPAGSGWISSSSGRGPGPGAFAPVGFKVRELGLPQATRAQGDFFPEGDSGCPRQRPGLARRQCLKDNHLTTSSLDAYARRRVKLCDRWILQSSITSPARTCVATPTHAIIDIETLHIKILYV